MFGINELSWTPFPASILFNAPKTTYAAEEFPTIFDVAPDADKTGQIVSVRWNGSNYIPSFTDGGFGNAGTYDAAGTVSWLRNGLAKTRGQGIKFTALSPADKIANCAAGCDDKFRKTTAEGCCEADCKDGWEFDATNNCVATANNTDPNDCASENRAVNDDETCGDCLSGYSEDTAGDCVADEPDGPNYALWGGIAVVVVIGFLMG